MELGIPRVEGILKNIQDRINKISKKTGKDIKLKLIQKSINSVTFEDGSFYMVDLYEINDDLTFQVEGYEVIGVRKKLEVKTKTVDVGRVIDKENITLDQDMLYCSVDNYETLKGIPFSSHCDHCNNNKIKNTVVYIRETATNKVMAVGRSCLKDYTGHPSITQIVDSFMFAYEAMSMAAMAQLIDGYDEISSYRTNFIGSAKALAVNVYQYLHDNGTAHYNAMANKSGYNRPIDYFYVDMDDKCKELNKPVNDSGRYDHIMRSLESLDDSSYKNNLISIFESEVVLACNRKVFYSFLYTLYNREVRETTKVEFKEGLHKYNADRVLNVTFKSVTEQLTFVSTKEVENKFGVSTMVTLKDSECYKYVTFTTSQKLIDRLTNCNNTPVTFDVTDCEVYRGVYSAKIKIK